MADQGSEHLAALGKRLKTVGDKSLRRELLRGLKAGAEPLVTAVADAARSQLPKRGGLNEQVAGQKVKVQVRTGARTAGVRLTTTAPDTKQTDSGFVRHPSWGRRGKGQWKTQQIPAAKGWWSQTLADGGPAVQPELTAVMDRIATEVQGGI